MADEKVDFELVSPEQLLVSAQVDMVVVPGTEGNFGVLPRHAPLISTMRPGVIEIHDGGQVRSRIFVADGFAEATPERCTALAEYAVPVDEIDGAEAEQQLKNAREDLAEADTDQKQQNAKKRIAVGEAMLRAAGR
jgi:F-type H+-transporting ATPase subunit epsilon